jgi:hypothetical protein
MAGRCCGPLLPGLPGTNSVEPSFLALMKGGQSL